MPDAPGDRHLGGHGRNSSPKEDLFRVETFESNGSTVESPDTLESSLPEESHNPHAEFGKQPSFGKVLSQKLPFGKMESTRSRASRTSKKSPKSSSSEVSTVPSQKEEPVDESAVRDYISRRTLTEEDVEVMSPKHSSLMKGRKAGELYDKVLNATKKEQEENEPSLWIHSGQADAIFGLAIVLNAVVIGVETDIESAGHISMECFVLQCILLIVFLVELGLRVQAEGLEFFKTFWGCLDLILNSLAVTDMFVLKVTVLISEDGNEANQDGDGDTSESMRMALILRVFRLLRLVRIVKLMGIFQELYMMVQTLFSSVISVGWMMVVTTVILYMGAVYCTVFIGQDEAMLEKRPELQWHFGDVLKALYVHFKILSAEGWKDVANIVMDAANHPAGWGLYFGVMVALTNFALLSIVTGVLTEYTHRTAMYYREEMCQINAEDPSFHIMMKGIYSCACLDRDRKALNHPELRMIFESQDARRLMAMYNLNLDVTFNQLQTLFDPDNSGWITYGQFVQGCLTLKGLRDGSKSTWQTFLMQYDCHNAFAEVLRSIDLIEREAKDIMHRQAKARRAAKQQRTLSRRTAISVPSFSASGNDSLRMSALQKAASPPLDDVEVLAQKALVKEVCQKVLTAVDTKDLALGDAVSSLSKETSRQCLFDDLGYEMRSGNLEPEKVLHALLEKGNGFVSRSDNFYWWPQRPQ